MDAELAKMFRMTIQNGLRITSDIDLLPAVLSSESDISSAIVLVVGTGSVAMSYERSGCEFHRTGRAGGWGSLLGDDGSGYSLGREGIRKTLRHCDLHTLRSRSGAKPTAFPPLAQAVLKHFQSVYPGCEPATLLTNLLVPAPGLHIKEDGSTSKTKAFASAASVVLAMAGEDNEAKRILGSGASSVAELVSILVQEQKMDINHCALVLGGGIMRNPLYKEMVMHAVENQCGNFRQVKFVSEPAVVGARELVRTLENSPAPQ